MFIVLQIVLIDSSHFSSFFVWFIPVFRFKSGTWCSHPDCFNPPSRGNHAAAAAHLASEGTPVDAGAGSALGSSRALEVTHSCPRSAGRSPAARHQHPAPSASTLTGKAEAESSNRHARDVCNEHGTTWLNTYLISKDPFKRVSI